MSVIKAFLRYSFSFAVLISAFNCANRGTPTGGEKDITPPVIIKSEPENFSTNFTDKEIKVYFDEYIKVQNLQKNLIISPPMDLQPEITPLGGASKYLTIKIFDTLQPNTTYAFNFGESIVDNNESNPFPFYRYVFSTGEYIDSLKIKGTISDGLDKEPEEFVTVMLYEVDSTFTDSIIYKEKPKYISNTIDSTYFELQNLKAGNYLLVALKDESSNYTFQPKQDKIGFVEKIISVPEDSVHHIKLFKEELDFKATRPKQMAGQKIAFGYEGDHKEMQIKILSQIPDNFAYHITKDPEQDSLNYWYNPKLEVDSLIFAVSNNTKVDTFTVRINDLEKDSLVVTGSPRGAINFEEEFQLEGTIPFKQFDPTKVSLIDKDSIPVTYDHRLDTLNNKHLFTFEKGEEQSYSFQFLPGAFTDFFENQNDSLEINLRTRTFSDFGNIRLTLQNAEYPVIVQILTENGEVTYERYSERPEPLDFFNVSPTNYLIRVVYDSNKNRVYDSGNYLKKLQPERVSYFPELVEIRAGWDWINEFILLD